MEVLMRISIPAILAAGAALAAPAHAQTYDPRFPFCVQVYQSFVDYYFDCSYYTLAQCQASASGRAASCVANPYYGGQAGRPVVRHRRPHHH
jgi:Protein of unknown function (DUF3551)